MELKHQILQIYTFQNISQIHKFKFEKGGDKIPSIELKSERKIERERGHGELRETARGKKEEALGQI